MSRFTYKENIGERMDAYFYPDKETIKLMSRSGHAMNISYAQMEELIYYFRTGEIYE